MAGSVCKSWTRLSAGGAAVACKAKRRGLFFCALFALLALVFLPFCACQSLKKAAAPIAIYDARIAGQDDGEGLFRLGVEFSAANLSGRPLKSAVFCAALSQAAGEGDLWQDDDFFDFLPQGVLTVDGGRSDSSSLLEPGGEARLFIPMECLDGADTAADSMEIEKLCLERAEYEGGEVWKR